MDLGRGCYSVIISCSEFQAETRMTRAVTTTIFFGEHREFNDFHAY